MQFCRNTRRYKVSIVLKHPDARVYIDELSNGRKNITICRIKSSIFIKQKTCQTHYPIDLIRQILNLKTPAYLCDEILRDENPEYVRNIIEKNLLGYMEKTEFMNKRILDFGCGSGASSIILAKMFPTAEITGVDISEEHLSIAQARQVFYELANLRFFLSPRTEEIPDDIGRFDYIIMSAVYEHLLPHERPLILNKLWSVLKTNGILFVFDTPYRYFPVERHTTGLPLINYLTDRVVLFIVRLFSKGIKKNESWQSLLRMGIRGGTEKEIVGLLVKGKNKNILVLEPNRLGCCDRIDLWYLLYSSHKKSILKGIIVKLLKRILKVIKLLFGITFVHSLSLAIKKIPNKLK